MPLPDERRAGRASDLIARFQATIDKDKDTSQSPAVLPPPLARSVSASSVQTTPVKVVDDPIPLSSPTPHAPVNKETPVQLEKPVEPVTPEKKIATHEPLTNPSPRKRLSSAAPTASFLAKQKAAQEERDRLRKSTSSNKTPLSSSLKASTTSSPARAKPPSVVKSTENLSKASPSRKPSAFSKSVSKNPVKKDISAPAAKTSSTSKPATPRASPEANLTPAKRERTAMITPSALSKSSSKASLRKETSLLHTPSPSRDRSSSLLSSSSRTSKTTNSPIVSKSKPAATRTKTVKSGSNVGELPISKSANSSSQELKGDKEQLAYDLEPVTPVEEILTEHGDFVEQTRLAGASLTEGITSEETAQSPVADQLLQIARDDTENAKGKDDIQSEHGTNDRTEDLLLAQGMDHKRTGSEFSNISDIPDMISDEDTTQTTQHTSTSDQDFTRSLAPSPSPKASGSRNGVLLPLGDDDSPPQSIFVDTTERFQTEEQVAMPQDPADKEVAAAVKKVPIWMRKGGEL